MSSTIIAVFTVLSPIIAVLLASYLQRLATLTTTKHQVFLALMAHRNDPLPTQEWVNSLNVIEAVYASHSVVLEKWRTLFEILERQPLNIEQMNRGKIELIESIGSTLGYRSLRQLDIQRFYTPIAHGNQLAFSETFQNQLLTSLQKLDQFLSQKIDGGTKK